MTDWDAGSYKILVEFLHDSEYLYNRNHRDYKIYTVIKECAEFGKNLTPPKSSKEVLDKITAMRKDITLAKQIIENKSNELIFSEKFNFQKFKENVIKCSFMYTALFGESYDSIMVKLNQFLDKTFKRKLADDERPDTKKLKMNTENIKSLTNLETDCASENSEDKDGYFVEEIVSTQNENSQENMIDNETNVLIANNYCASQHSNENSIEYSEFENSSFKQKNDCFVLENNDIINTTKVLNLDRTKKMSNDEIVTLKIINFIRNKPYYYKAGTDLYRNKAFKNKELDCFGKTFKPPISGDHIKSIIKYIVKKFHSSIEKPVHNRWHWFDQCKFLLNSSKNVNSAFKNSSVNTKKLEINRTDDPKLLLEVVTFVEDNPCFYDENDEYFYNHSKKCDMKNRFIEALKFKYDENDIANLLDYVHKRISEQFNNNYHGNVDSSKISIGNSTFGLGEDDSSIYSVDSVFKENPIQEVEKYRVASVQCNLYEELLEQKIKEYNFNDRNCHCIEDFLQTFLSHNDGKLNTSLYNDISEESNIIKEEYNNMYEYESDEHMKIGNYLMETDSLNFSDLSSDDGLSEVPFEDIQPKIRAARLPNGKIPCEDCDLLFDDYVQFNAHEQTHGEKSLLCYKCGKINKYYRKLRLHENNCDPEGDKKCYECNVIFHSHLNYYDHQNQFHTKSNPYICVCRQAFTSYNKIIQHLNRSDCGSIDDCVLPEYVTKDFIKGFIEQKYDDEEEFVKTMEKTKFWCKICKRNYVRNNVYMKHFTRPHHLTAERDWLRQYGVEKIFACDYCNNDDEPTTFKNLHQLVTHRHQTHHKCTLTEFLEEIENIARSPKAFELPAELSQVVLVCRICNIKYEMNYFKNHFRYKEHKKHERNWIINHNLKLFTCDICSNTFESLIQYLEHKHEVHLEWPTNKLIKEIEGVNIELIGKKYYKYYCSICDYKTNNRRFYANHVLIHGTHYKCSCGASYKSYDKFLSHKTANNCETDGCIEFSSKMVFKILN